MEHKQSEVQSRGQDGPINYMPGMPALSTEPGRLEQFVHRVSRRRGALQPVVRSQD